MQQLQSSESSAISPHASGLRRRAFLRLGLLAALVVWGLRDLPPAVALGGGAALLLLIVVALALSRSTVGIVLGWLVQVLLIAAGAVQVAVGCVHVPLTSRKMTPLPCAAYPDQLELVTASASTVGVDRAPNANGDAPAMTSARAATLAPRRTIPARRAPDHRFRRPERNFGVGGVEGLTHINASWQV